MEPTAEFPASSTPPAPETILGRLKGELRIAATLITTEIAQLDPKASPTTFQTFRWLGGAMVECEKRLMHAAKVAEITPADVEVPEFLFQQIADTLANAEGRFLTAFDKCLLNDLPPGNPREPEFERLLKIKWATNKAVQEAMQNFGALAAALNADTYKLDITEETRVVAWRAARRKQFEDQLANIDKQKAEITQALTYLEAARAKVVLYLTENDQMVFDDIDPTKPVIMGEESQGDEAPL